MADIKYYGVESHFNENVTFYKDVNINGNLKYDSLTVRNLTVRERATLGVTTTTSLSAQSLNVSGIITATSFNGDGSNLQVNGTSLSSAISAAVPTGVILMWSGSIATIPTGWALCDGSNNTPDLRNRFIVGAHSGAGIGTISTSGPGFNVSTGALNSNYTPGNIGGETAHQLTIAELAAHTHSGGAQWPGSGPEQDQSGGPENRTTFNIDTGSTGGDKYHENRPPYYALAYIMKT